jgi:hypothetical protein
MAHKTNIIVCGQIRNEDLFLAAINQYMELRRLGACERIIYSAWQGHLDDFPQARRVLAESGIDTVEASEPSGLVAEGHYFHQQASLSHGLDLIDPSDRVLKTRSDLLFSDPMAIYALTRADYTIPEPATYLSPIRERLWVPFFEAVTPFFIGDHVIYGRVADVQKLCNFSIRQEARTQFKTVNGMTYPNFLHGQGPEKRIFAPLFAERIPLLRAYDACYAYFPNSPAALAAAVEDPIYWQLLGLYYYCIAHFLRVGGDVIQGRISGVSRLGTGLGTPARYELSDVYPRSTVRPEQFSPLFDSPRKAFHWCDDMRWVNRVLRGEIADGAASAKLIVGLATGLMATESSGAMDTYRQHLLHALNAAAYESD